MGAAGHKYASEQLIWKRWTILEEYFKILKYIAFWRNPLLVKLMGIALQSWAWTRCNLSYFRMIHGEGVEVFISVNTVFIFSVLLLKVTITLLEVWWWVFRKADEI